MNQKPGAGELSTAPPLPPLPMGAEKCEELLKGDARTLWHAYCDVHAEMDKDRENDKKGWANYVDKLSTMLMGSDYSYGWHKYY